MSDLLKTKIQNLYIFLPIFVYMIFVLIIYCDDYFFHIRLGEYILENGVNKTEPFSWIGKELGLYWVNHEWISEILLVGIYSIFKTYTPYVYITGCFLITLSIIFFYNRRNLVKHEFFYIIWAIYFVVLFKYSGTPRPHLLSGIFLLIQLILAEYVYKNKKNGIWLLYLPVSVLWVNTHGGAAHLSWIIPLLYLLSGLFKFKYGRIIQIKLNSIQIRRYLTMFISSILSLFINPFGIEGFLYFFTKNKFEYKVINEWQPLKMSSFTDITYIFILFSILCLFISVINSKKNINTKDVLLLGFFLILTLRYSRFEFLYFLCFSFIYPKYITKEYKLPRISMMIISTIFLIFAIFLGVSTIEDKKIYKDEIPKESLDIIELYKPKRLYNGLDIGENLIYAGYECFADSRCDLYKDEIFNESILFDMNSANLNIQYNFSPDEFVDKYKFDGFIVNKKDGSNEYLKNKYRLVYEDKYIKYYKQ